MSTPDGLREAAIATLAGNWTGTSTLPSRAQYPHQWSWDSAFIAIGLAEFDPDRARRELVSLFGASGSPAGSRTSSTTDVAAGDYSPAPAFWATPRAGRPAVPDVGDRPAAGARAGRR